MKRIFIILMVIGYIPIKAQLHVDTVATTIISKNIVFNELQRTISYGGDSMQYKINTCNISDFLETKEVDYRFLKSDLFGLFLIEITVSDNKLIEMHIAGDNCNKFIIAMEPYTREWFRLKGFKAIDFIEFWEFLERSDYVGRNTKSFLEETFIEEVDIKCYYNYYKKNKKRKVCNIPCDFPFNQ